MTIRRKLRAVRELFGCFSRRPRLSLSLLRQVPVILRGFEYTEKWTAGTAAARETAVPDNPLRAFFERQTTGPGIWKWTYLFDVYHRHFSRFVGREVHVLEVGIYSGGSLAMWREYFGPRCRIYGIDIEDGCRMYENEHTKIFIGDQEDRNFWRDIRKQVPVVDILIDDGGHHTAQQIATLEEMLPHLSPGGVYLCEDTFGPLKGFTDYLHGFIHNLNTYSPVTENTTAPTGFQSSIKSVHFYPFVTVIEKNEAPVTSFTHEMRGSEWRPLVIR